MIRVSKANSWIVPHFVLPQSYPPFGIRGVPAPLLPHVGARHKVMSPLMCKHNVWNDF